MGVIRNLPEQEIESLLHRAIIGRIACCDHGKSGTSRPYLVPIAFGYDGNAVYFHSGPGRKLDLMRAEPLVTFEVDEGAAPDWWESVIAEGTFEELHSPGEREAALKLIYPDTEPLPDLPPDTSVVRIKLTSRSGRYERPD